MRIQLYEHPIRSSPFVHHGERLEAAGALPHRSRQEVEMCSDCWLTLLEGEKVGANIIAVLRGNEMDFD